MKPLYVCTQTVDRLDCLAQLVASCEASTRKPDGIFVVDHGYDSLKVLEATRTPTIPVTIITLHDPGCSHNGNWYIQHVPDDRVCCGDDVVFEPTALEILAQTPGDFVIPFPNINPAACCLIRQSCVEKLAEFDRGYDGDFPGLFDELISPGYLYFDDTDFLRRMELAGIQQTAGHGPPNLGIQHRSKSLRLVTVDHHPRAIHGVRHMFFFQHVLRHL